MILKLKHLWRILIVHTNNELMNEYNLGEESSVDLTDFSHFLLASNTYELMMSIRTLS